MDHDEYEYGPMCDDRAAKGYNSGMGEIFRKVAGISPVKLLPDTKEAPAIASPSDVEEKVYEAF